MTFLLMLQSLMLQVLQTRTRNIDYFSFVYQILINYVYNYFLMTFLLMLQSLILQVLQTRTFRFVPIGQDVPL